MGKSFKYHDKVCENIEFCRIVIPSEKDKILEFKQYMKSDKVWYIIYADIESLIRKIDGRANNPEKSSKMEIGELIPSGYSMSTILGFNHIEDKYTLYLGKDCMKKFCESLREHAKCITDFEKKNFLPLTRTDLKSFIAIDVCHTCVIRFLKNFSKNINYRNVTGHCYYTGK